MPFHRLFLIATSLILVTACAKPNLETRPLEELGNFKMGHNIVVGETARRIDPSRDATADEWEAVLQTAIDNRLGRYDGDKFYNVAVSIDAYALAIPGIPLVVSPKSTIVVSVTLWDDRKGEKLNTEVRQFVVFESLSAENAIGSGLTQTKEKQMENLAFNAAKKIEEWLVENKTWFGVSQSDIN
ncbi:hypothetical protein [Parasulfitobacter algicola]|uniref:Lipoprotein n=1 Tax=Parasulfitobacter algicola TaxID=2614809 RepID=A0ABX2ISX6_9RHOB|nr:hypothetical protein [Sulfitobacter algicola]NSX53902.1 hypothetical protein [Sulfitobacter algicola]